ncbi:hypothetical protein [Paraburkholderia strydomiana]|uniref:hypothetical protein n=1 Tax=Paraburkholderia strydomiana TaxID=1245417 RepID=UPI002855870F|nr:hypothetical protein [Paraburkholderia strydomiana]MDR7006221.1 hypothetical protein [Paraburkholderia strydomiana]
MRGIPKIQAVIEPNDAASYIAFCRLDTRKHVRMSVHVDCSIAADATDTTSASRAVSPNNAARAAYHYGAVPGLLHQ